MSLTSPYSDEALDHRAKPDPLDDPIRASPPRERLVARTTAMAVAALLVAALFAPIESSTAMRVAIVEEGPATADRGRLRLQADAAALDDASRNALAVLPQGAPVTLVGDAWLVDGHLLGVFAASANGVAVDVLLSRPVESGLVPTERAVLRLPGGRRSVAAALAELASATPFE